MVEQIYKSTRVHEINVNDRERTRSYFIQYNKLKERFLELLKIEIYQTEFFKLIQCHFYGNMESFIIPSPVIKHLSTLKKTKIGIWNAHKFVNTKTHNNKHFVEYYSKKYTLNYMNRQRKYVASAPLSIWVINVKIEIHKYVLCMIFYFNSNF